MTTRWKQKASVASASIAIAVLLILIILLWSAISNDMLTTNTHNQNVINIHENIVNSATTSTKYQKTDDKSYEKLKSFNQNIINKISTASSSVPTNSTNENRTRQNVADDDDDDDIHKFEIVEDNRRSQGKFCVQFQIN